MRVLLFISLLLAVLVCSVQADDAGTCKKKWPNLYNLITNYCLGPNKSGFTSPGAWAENGAADDKHDRYCGVNSGPYTGGKKNAFGPPCKPVTWIPTYWCRAQFYSVCTKYKGNEQWQSKNYGPGGCQNFWVQ